jgi:hypothetical protein
MPTIQENALIVVFSASMFNPRKTDKKVTDEVIANHNAKNDAGKFVKAIISEAAVKPIQAVIGEARTFHYANTLPWLQDGGRIIPLAHYQTYKVKMEAFKARFSTAVDEFCANYANAIEDARERLKDMFNPSDYPSDVATKFSFTTTCFPIPSGNDFRFGLSSGLSDEDRDQLTAGVNSAVQAVEQLGIREVADRVKTCLRSIVDRLGTPGAIFRDTLIGNLAEVAALIPVLNITNDSCLQDLQRDIQPLTTLNPDALRESRAQRNDACQKAREILARMEQMFVVAPDEEV